MRVSHHIFLAYVSLTFSSILCAQTPTHWTLHACTTQLGGHSLKKTNQTLWEVCYVSESKNLSADPTHLRVEVMSREKCEGPAVVGKETCLIPLPYAYFKIEQRQAIAPHQFVNGPKVNRNAILVRDVATGVRTRLTEHLAQDSSVLHFVGNLLDYEVTAYYFQWN